MPSETTNEATRREWRKLGFFYDRDDSAKEWKIVGSREGLRTFAHIIRRYASNPENNVLSGHDHYGPYMYLEIGTWSESQITNHWIAGPVDNLLKLSSTVEQLIAAASVGDRLPLRVAFAQASPYDLVLEMRDDTFDPPSADSNCSQP
jgi:hypothetical protein